MKTLYEVLEVSENASKEIIEKAYRVLAKKYHPDLQTAENKQKAENKMKEINEAYSILGDETKRREYDNQLASQREANKIRYETNNEAQNYQNANQGAYYKQQNNSQQPHYEAQNATYSQKQRPTQEEYRKAKRMQEEAIRRQQQMEQEMQAQYEQKYQRAYENYLRSLGYKIKYKWTWKNYKDFFITILIITGICTVLWFFPPTHNMIMDFYNSNAIVKTIVDVIGGILRGIWNAICSIFVTI